MVGLVELYAHPTSQHSITYSPDITAMSSPEETDAILARHRKELRDLQALVTQKKKAATKKTRKNVNAECERLEAELKARQHRELHPVQEEAEEAESVYIPAPSPSPEPKSAPAPAAQTPPPAPEPQTKKPNRQKARLARRAAEQLAAAEEAEKEAASLPNLRAKELTAMKSLLSTHELKEHPIPPDGHCLYSAFARNTEDSGGYTSARRKCAAYIREHPDDFAPFIEDGTVEELAAKVEGTAEWGGQLEVMALAGAYGVAVKVLQGEGRVEEMGQGEKTVWLGYYRHAFGLGEHYNALEKA